MQFTDDGEVDCRSDCNAIKRLHETFVTPGVIHIHRQYFKCNQMTLGVVISTFTCRLHNSVHCYNGMHYVNYCCVYDVSHRYRSTA